MMLERGTLLVNRYRIVEILGQGGMGSVYRAVDENLDIVVAVKDNSFTTEEYARQFRREATILATLRHPSLPRVTDHFVIENQGQYLVMDYIEGEDLRQRMERQGCLEDEEVIVIGAAICDALTFLGSRNPPIIHRDIKPGNVKITPSGHIYLVDFGLAKTLFGAQATTTGARAMTPGFSPPEQYGTARTDARTDIFSLGATLYAALTGVTPEDALARAMGQAELTSLRKQNARIGRRLAAAIEKSLELLPDERYQTAEEFKQALLIASARKREGNYVVAPPPEAEVEAAAPDSTPQNEAAEQNAAAPLANSNGKRPLSPISPARSEAREFKPIAKPVKRSHRLTSCLLELVLVVAIVAIGIYIFRFDRKLPARLLLQYWPAISEYLPLPTVSLSPTLSSTPELPVERNPSQTPTPIHLPSSASPTSTVTDTPVLPTATPLAIATFTATPTATSIPQATPVGSRSGQIAFASKSKGVPQIFIIRSDSQELIQITNLPEGACQPDFSPDGQRILYTSPCDDNKISYPLSSLHIVKVDGGETLDLPTEVGGDYDPAWSPDGRYIAFTSLRNSNRPGLFLLNLENRTFASLSQKYAFDSQPAWSKDGQQLVFTSNRNGRQEIWVMELADQQQKQFSYTKVYQNLNPSWSTNGKNVISTQLLTDNAVPRVIIAPYQFKDYIESAIDPKKRAMRDGVMSPDGFWIAVEGWESGGKHNIFIISTDGLTFLPVTDDPVMAFDPAWNPAP